MSGTVYRLSLLLLTLGWVPSSFAGPAAPAGAPLISFAEQPVRLWRDTGVYIAGRGARLQDSDIVASNTAGIQVEAGGATVALGPATQVGLRIKANAIDFVLLNGWMKIQSGGVANAAGKLVSASAGGVRFSTQGSPNAGAGASAVIVHTSGQNTEFFVESGEAVIEDAQAGKRGRLTLAREQYAVKVSLNGTRQPVKLLPRPGKQFLADMPPVFADRLVAVAAKAGTSALRLEHPAVFAEVAPWLSDEPALRLIVQRRLAPRKPAPALQPSPR